MPDKRFRMGSNKWIPAINDLCFDFLKYLQKQPGGKFLRFQDNLIGTEENPGSIVEEYNKTVCSLKAEIFGKDADQSHIDYHKIASLYIRSFLMYKPFCVDIPEGTKNIDWVLITKRPNEYFSIAFLEAIFQSWNERFELDGLLRMNPSYRCDFIKLLYRYGKDINKLDPLSLSNIIFLIEKCYFNSEITKEKA
jgi:hypothetical protein